MIRNLGKSFILETLSTSYIFKVLPTGHLEHLYYGKKVIVNNEEDLDALVEKHAFAPGNTNIYNPDHPEFSLEDICLEMSSYGKGDIRVPFVEMSHVDGSTTCDFLYSSFSINDKKSSISTLPSSLSDEKESQELKVTLVDSEYNITLELYYYVAYTHDVITRRAVVINNSDQEVRLNRIMSNMVDFDSKDFVFTTFNGNWTNEMNRHDNFVESGMHINASFTGSSSSRANPFVMLSTKTTSEDYGEAYGFNLIYSGNHYEALEVSPYGKTRFVNGINPSNFSYLLEENEVFETPESIMTYSDQGFNGMSNNMHSFINNCIVRGEWKDKERPILLNSWEANYFKINEAKLVKQAKAAKKVGIELFVMDDGWFGHRDGDNSSLGDWYVNKKKLPHGLKGLADKINAIGMDFGIWVEPEMISVDSDLYRAHPEWAIDIPNHPHSEGRNQRILDLCNPEVVDYVIEAMSDVFSSANISYVKWDMNRTFTDIYSKYLPAKRQQEVFHRYMIGLYKIMDTLTQKFPHILFEGCAAGGNRFDLGILSYFPQIWASDDTDALVRVNVQTSYSYGYPLSTLSNHVSNTPNHQTLRITPLTTRFNVASFGVLGYECNLVDLSKEEISEIKEQIALYKKYRHTLQFGDFYRINNDELHNWNVVSKDKTTSLGMIMQELVKPNHAHHFFKARGLDVNKIYRFINRKLEYNVKLFGDLINTASPVHVKPNSFLQNTISKFVKMPGETEDFKSTGGIIMNGVSLKQAFTATGYNEETRYFQDFGSRLYIMEEESTKM